MRQEELSEECRPFASDKMRQANRVKNDTDLLLRVRQDKKSREKNDADLLLKVG